MDTLTIADDNDYVAFAGPIKGPDPATRQKVTYHGTDVVAIITDDPASNTPIGTLTYNSTEMTVPFAEPVAVGYHYLAWLERGADGTTTNFLGSNAGMQSGMIAKVNG